MTQSRTGAPGADPEHLHILFSQENPADPSREACLEQGPSASSRGRVSFLRGSGSHPELQIVPIPSLHHRAGAQGLSQWPCMVALLLAGY